MLKKIKRRANKQSQKTEIKSKREKIATEKKEQEKHHFSQVKIFQAKQEQLAMKKNITSAPDHTPSTLMEAL